MFSKPTSFYDLCVKSFKSLPYVSLGLGLFFGAIGLNSIYSAYSFKQNSVPQQLVVIAVDSRQTKDGTVYRPRFQAVGKDGKSLQYSGHTWISPKPHEAGDIVDGRVNWASGEIRSVGMINFGTSIGKMSLKAGGIAFLLGLIYFTLKKIRRFFSKQTS